MAAKHHYLMLLTCCSLKIHFSHVRKAEVSLNESSLLLPINTSVVDVHDDKANAKLTVSLPPGKTHSAKQPFG